MASAIQVSTASPAPSRLRLQMVLLATSALPAASVSRAPPTPRTVPLVTTILLQASRRRLTAFRAQWASTAVGRIQHLRQHLLAHALLGITALVEQQSRPSSPPKLGTTHLQAPLPRRHAQLGHTIRTLLNHPAFHALPGITARQQACPHSPIALQANIAQAAQSRPTPAKLEHTMTPRTVPLRRPACHVSRASTAQAQELPHRRPNALPDTSAPRVL